MAAKKMKFRTPYNMSEFPKDLEKNSMPDKTIPNQALTVLELVRRHEAGRPITGGRTPVYNGDVDLPDLRRMDISEIDELKRRTQDNIEEIHKEIKRKRDEFAEAERSKLVELEKKVRDLEIYKKSNPILKVNRDEEPEA